MSRVPLKTTADAPAASRPALEQIGAAFGATPAMFRAVANSPAALGSMWGAFGALGTGRLPAALTESIAVAIADRNGCEYCLAAHSALAKKAGVAPDAIAEAQAGRSTDARTAAALTFALAVLERRAHVDDAEVAAVRSAGFDDGEIVELIAHVALNVYTNYVNVALDVPVDFPKVRLRSAA
jgi:uncharacterized peroxidase-related enzyme